MKITVLLGGRSAERDVSIASGLGIMKALRGRGHEVLPLDPALPLAAQREPEAAAMGEIPPEEPAPLPPEDVFRWLWSPAVREADVVFNALHGGAGEDGRVQALLETAGKPYTGTGVMGSALAMNKDRSKALFAEAGVRTAPHLLTCVAGEIEARRVLQTIEEGIGFPAVVKPNNQGSSVGFSYLPGPEGLEEALRGASCYDNVLMVERYVAGREITAAVLDGAALPLVEILPDGGFYDYKHKYTKGASRYIAPAPLDGRIAERIRREAVLAYGALECRDYARVDFRLGEDGEPSCLEVNTLPGMTELSLVPMAAAAAGMGFGELAERICLLARSRGPRKEA